VIRQDSGDKGELILRREMARLFPDDFVKPYDA
jgi:hypothetical protein